MKQDYKRDKKDSFRNNKRKFSSGGFRPREERFEEMRPFEKALISDITIKSKGANVIIEGIIDSIGQTGGPTIINISDGTGTLPLKAFVGAGIRAYPELNEGDAVHAKVTIQEYNNELEGEIKIAYKLSDSDKAKMLVNVDKIQRERAQVKPIDFLVDDKILDKLKDLFTKAATEIRLAIIQNRPIIIRHHSDADGYSSGYSLERAILPLILKQHTGVKAAWEFYTRAPCNSPMYELDDSIRDTAHSLANAAKFSNKMPLVLIVDTGSGEKDLLGIKQGKVHGIDFIVVDHHAFDKDLISDEVLVHINPFLVGEDGTKYSAGMLCTELARFINPDPNLNIIQIPAMAGLADRIDNPSTLKKYIELAEKKGYSKKMLADISSVIDFISSKLRFMEAREYIEVLFGEPMVKQKALVDLLSPYIRDLENKGIEISKDVSQKEKVKSVTLQSLDIESTFARGFYPKPGKCIGMLHDHAMEKDKTEKIVTISIMADAIIIRASPDSGFSVNEFVDYLQEKLKEAYVEGGGHKLAGSIRFLPSKKQKVISAIKDYIKSVSG